MIILFLYKNEIWILIFFLIIFNPEEEKLKIKSLSYTLNLINRIFSRIIFNLLGGFLMGNKIKTQRKKYFNEKPDCLEINENDFDNEASKSPVNKGTSLY